MTRENTFPLNMSNRIRLEACSACQLRCPSCPTATGHTDRVVGQNWLKLADFVTLIDANPWIGTVELSNYGEVFLNPELLGILRHAHERNVAITLGNGANLNHVTGDVLEGLVRYRVLVLLCSIDGASEETYRRYRVRGNLSRVLENIRKLNAFKRALASPLPNLIWQFIAFGHNEHEIETARALAAELGMAFEVKLTWDDTFSPVKDKDAIRRATKTGAASRAEFSALNNREYLSDICHQLWDAPQINWDGKLLGCCRNFWGDFGGNAFRDGLAESLSHEKMAYGRAMLEGQAPPREDIPCSTCELYTKRKERERWFAPHRSAKRFDEQTAAELWGRSRELDAAGKGPEAAAWARITLQVEPGHKPALLRLALAADRAGRPEAAAYYRGKAG